MVQERKLMAELDRYECIGRVGSTKMVFLNDGTPCMEMSVAVDQSYKKQDGSKVEKVFWCRVKAFGKQAEFIEKWCHKGKRVLVIAQPEERSWPDQQGNKRSTIEFQVRAPGTGVTAPTIQPSVRNPGRRRGDGDMRTTRGRRSRVRPAAWTMCLFRIISTG
jgi:single stranded DNA-binding protein